jgi:hypothetical protein
MELRKLRNKNKGASDKAGGEKKEDDKKDPKKPAAPAGKAPEPALNKPKPNSKGVDATPEELAEINHVYVYLVVKRSANPEGAVYDLNIVMYDE